MIDYENLGKLNAPFREKFLQKFEGFLDSGWYVLGESVAAFEQAFAEYHTMKHCVGVASGLDALILALDALNLPPESEVILPSNTYIATILAVIRAGLKPVLVEPNIRTYNIDPELVRDAVTPKTRVIIPVHLYGKCCDMTSIQKAAEEHGLYIVEDCAQAHGSRHKGKLVGTFSDIAAFSFYPTKNLGALGDAGAVLCDLEKWDSKIRSLRNYGSRKKYVNDDLGYNSRLDEVQAGFLLIKLRELEQINAHKQKLASVYLQNLTSELQLPDPSENVFHIFPVRTERRDALREYLLKHEIKTEIHYPIPPHQQKGLGGHLEGSYPISEEIHETILSLPISFCHSEGEIRKVIEVINKFFN